ncbi:hypothetical protein [Paenibacillus sacheonensis]|uniref:Uncharacterized protein n=1 Tax=Paenibacillus sacheonensis TaxID=742054 RepID=A0A7X4YQX4_9BACL|nr:hypothetical protein [Paenibacillus sacheonensis]MBM7565260.1 hypothetical protein [Paenibacillus sacheonensis]NBC69966.1 hypothetical protein [Paenibacillus sacheonensis]
MESRIGIIERALNNVGGGYHQVITTYSSNVIRERVFCYELYHQIRLIMGDGPELSLCGEIDKSGHRDFRRADQKNPDFILHNAGSHSNNELVIEVKGVLDKKQTKKDFQTINTFIRDYNYRNGIFILFNHSLHEFIEKFMKWFSEDISKFNYTSNNIYIMCKKDGCTKTEIILLRDLITNFA